jgi:hypothetical protein
VTDGRSGGDPPPEGIDVDDSTWQAAAEAAQAELAALVGWLREQPELALGTAEQEVLERLRGLGARLVEAEVARRGAGKAGARRPCPGGGQAAFEGYRTKQAQTLLGWIRVRRAYYACPGCGRGQAPLDARLGLARDGHSPGVRRLASRFGGLMPFAQAAATLAEASGVRLSPSTLRAVSEAVGGRRDAALAEQAERAWAAGLPPAAGPARDLLYVAMDGVLVLDTRGVGMEAKVGVVVPVRRDAGGERRLAPSYAAGFAPAEPFGRRLALEAHRRGLERAALVVVLGDGAAWIWNLAAEHFPGAVCIVDWYHASERVWALGKALFGEGTPEAAAWVDAQQKRLGEGEVAALAAEWRALACEGAAAAERDEQVTYFTNQAERMAYDRYRALGLDIGSGMVESANKALIAQREKGPGMRWTAAGAEAIAQVRVLLANDQWDGHWQAA